MFQRVRRLVICNTKAESNSFSIDTDLEIWNVWCHLLTQSHTHSCHQSPPLLYTLNTDTHILPSGEVMSFALQVF